MGSGGGVRVGGCSEGGCSRGGFSGGGGQRRANVRGIEGGAKGQKLGGSSTESFCNLSLGFEIH